MANLKLYKANGMQINDNTLISRKTAEISIGKKQGSSCSITAPTVNGYEFVAWVESSTIGWVGSTYVADPTASNTKIWVGTSVFTSGTDKVIATAIYRPVLSN